MRTKKYLGQYFLKDKAVLRRIVEAAELSQDDNVLEIGAGTGVLTEELAKSARGVIAVEKDQSLCESLKKHFSQTKNIRVICADILKFDLTPYTLSLIPYKVVANIPYYITGRLLRLMAEEWPRPKLAVLTLQKEVAYRIAAKPPKMSLIAVAVQYWAEPKIVATVPRASFSPQPKVDSAIIKLQPVSNIFRSENVGYKRGFFEVVKLGFRQPRKLLASNLSKKFPKEKILSAFKKLDLSPKIRPAELSRDQWQSLYQHLF